MKTILGLISLLFLTLSGNCQQFTNVNLAWSPGSTNDGAIGGYKIYYGTSPITYTNVTTVPGRTNCTLTVTNLSRWRVYYFAATAYATNGLESDYSSEVTWTNRGNAPFALTISQP